jgi:8-oxo-dGTP pyrophosphatase MutT (NUDIX family)
VSDDDSTNPPVARPRVAAGLLIRDEAGSILLLKPTYKDGWDFPGGYAEPGESPGQAAARELKEELGAPLEVGRLLVVDWAPLEGEGDKMLFVFDGGLWPREFGQPLPASAEHSEARFFRLREAEGCTPPRLSRRLRLAVTAAEDGRQIYAEHGYGR